MKLKLVPAFVLAAVAFAAGPVRLLNVSYDPPRELYQEEALEVADRVAILSEGRIEQVGTPDEVYRKPANDFVREFLRDVNPRRLLA